MPPWLIIWIIRFASGERFRKATPEEIRGAAAWFSLIPLFLTLPMAFGESIPDHNNYWILLFFCTAYGVAFWLVAKLWEWLIPANISWIIGGLQWAAMFVLGLTCKLF